MSPIRRLLPLTLGLITLCTPAALAASSTGTLTVQAVVANSCTIGNATLNFGTYTQAAGATAAGTVTVNCSLLTPYTLTMNNGLNFESTSGKRRMQANVGGTNYFIPYTPVIAGALTVGGVPVPLAGTGLDVPYAITGIADAGSNVPAATYSDTVTMTVGF